MLPRTTHLRQDDTHRLVPFRYSKDESVLTRLTRAPAELAALFALEGATNARLQGEAGLLPGISLRELVFGFPYSHIVNAAFTHTRPGGNRFNGGDRGAWYAGLELATSVAEVAFHKQQELREIGWTESESFPYVDFLADFRGEFHDLRGEPRFPKCLDPASYAASQKLAADLLARGATGVVFPSVRRSGGTCLACFRPALVNHVRKGTKVTITFPGQDTAPEVQMGRPLRS